MKQSVLIAILVVISAIVLTGCHVATVGPDEHGVKAQLHYSSTIAPNVWDGVTTHGWWQPPRSVAKKVYVDATTTGTFLDVGGDPNNFPEYIQWGPDYLRAWNDNHGSVESSFGVSYKASKGTISWLFGVDYKYRTDEGDYLPDSLTGNAQTEVR